MGGWGLTSEFRTALSVNYTAGMARPKEFDRDTVLAEAIKVFSNHGFAGASTEDVLAAMKISRQSMYDTFGDKRRLYLEALERYSSESVSAIIRSIESGATPMQGVEAALVDFASRPVSEASIGCMGVASICEFGVSDAEISSINEVATERLVKALERALTAAQKAGEMCKHLKVRVAAQFVLMQFSGIKVFARGGASAAMLKDMARTGLRSLK